MMMKRLVKSSTMRSLTRSSHVTTKNLKISRKWMKRGMSLRIVQQESNSSSRRNLIRPIYLMTKSTTASSKNGRYLPGSTKQSKKRSKRIRLQHTLARENEMRSITRSKSQIRSGWRWLKLELIQRKNLREGVRRERKELLMTLMTWTKVPTNLISPLVDQNLKLKSGKLLEYKMSQKSIVSWTLVTKVDRRRNLSSARKKDKDRTKRTEAMMSTLQERLPRSNQLPRGKGLSEFRWVRNGYMLLH